MKAYLTGEKVYTNKAEAFLRSKVSENIKEVEVVESGEIWPETDGKGVYIGFEDGIEFRIEYDTYTDLQQGNDPDDMEEYQVECVDLNKIYVVLEAYKRSVNINSCGFTPAEIGHIQNACENHSGQNG